MEESSRYCKVCVTGGAGFIGSSLIKMLLDKGLYYVHATLRNLGDPIKVKVLKSMEGADTRLKLFEADIYNPQQFEVAIKDCQFVFHIATPLMHSPNSQYKDLIEASIGGVKSIITSCIRSGTVRRLIYTASVMAASPLKDDDTGFMDFVDENCWTPLHLPFVNSSIHKDYIISKTESEKEVLRFGEDGNMEVVTLVCGLVGGDTLLSYTPATTAVLLCQITEIESQYYQTFRCLEDLCGKIPIIHIHDICEAHIFCIQNDSINGRVLCASNYVSSTEIAECLEQTYPEFHVKQMYKEGPKRTIRWGSTKLTDHGFNYKYDMKMILDDCVNCSRRLDGLFSS
ncbi:anthocyanidin reductase ((2S)-flavan-3-ol-forming)-like isoform X2 [Spinacia oleracea]|uniref:Anthocyanidin reductase ((2S)-flavan-3-ol-forming)-like isoform X2 n=1 Tax=Spinacia oleracea TaxID=3562 RepID=A0ABM3RDB4_SPIOL|nr:anthocyanidin reductase ((2S)-flavan-3-ol-forming)-like isoform X2 [Spinacia oleracea]